jgi:hypothetical protein
LGRRGQHAAGIDPRDDDDDSARRGRAVHR